MSIRIRPPSAQSLPTFDEGGLGPPQAAVDEDYLAPLPKWNAALTLQPIADEAALPLSVILDEDAGYPLSRFAPRPLRALVFRASDSPTPSATVAIPDEVTPPLLLTAVRAILQPQPISHTDELPLQIARNEDYLFWQSTDIRRNLPQPFLDEADAPSFANVPVDEDPYVILGKRRA
ncbi:MAG: hypothetical protein KGR26_16585, partial [Cyanobacteria bacterium REEB65]|nr:hypothetical protein [Cyanobacteria bacterium REEB65]